MYTSWCEFFLNLFRRDLELNRSSSAVSMSCDNSDYAFAHKMPSKIRIEDLTELLEEPVEEKLPGEEVSKN